MRGTKDESGGVSGKLSREAAKRAVRGIAPYMGSTSHRRLHLIAKSLDERGNIKVSRAAGSLGGLSPLTPSAFREFRSAVARAAEEAGIRLRLVADLRKGDCAHFEGDSSLAADSARATLVQMARNALPGHLVDVPASIGNLGEMESESAHPSVADTICDWAEGSGNTHVVFLLGESGSGKTTASLTAALRLVENRSPLVPVYLNLDYVAPSPELAASLTDEELVRKVGRMDARLAQEAPLEELAKDGGALFILDSLDRLLSERPGRPTLYLIRRLARSLSDGGRNKVLLSIRPSYFESAQSELSKLRELSDWAKGEAAVMRLLPLSDSARKDLLLSLFSDREDEASELERLLGVEDEASEVLSRPSLAHLASCVVAVSPNHWRRLNSDPLSDAPLSKYEFLSELTRMQTGRSYSPFVGAHKDAILDELAVKLAANEDGMTGPELSDWLLGFVSAQPAMMLHYAPWRPAELISNLLCNSLLERGEDGRYRFISNLLQDFFRARHYRLAGEGGRITPPLPLDRLGPRVRQILGEPSLVS